MTVVSIYLTVKHHYLPFFAAVGSACHVSEPSLHILSIMRKRRKRRMKKSPFTLIELLVVIAIIAIVVASKVGFFLQFSAIFAFKAL